jgi:hypothetical protein
MLPGSRVSGVWVRALIMCDDVRFEVGGTMTLVGVFADRIVLPPGDGELVVPRLAIYSVVAGLTGTTGLEWQHHLFEEDRDPGHPIAAGKELHDAGADEHRLVNIVSPLVLPGQGRYRLAVGFRTPRAGCSVEHRLVIERASAE